MLKCFSKRSAPQVSSIRDALFGDIPLTELSEISIDSEPWISFAAAQQCLDQGDSAQGRAYLEAIIASPNLEPRHHLQAWSALNDLGVIPGKDSAKKVLGVVVEVALEGGLDLVAAYVDHSARYYNFSGAGVVWERPDGSLDSLIDVVLMCGQTICDQIGPWEGVRPPAPPLGQVRINLLTPSGLHFGQGSFAALSHDGLGGPMLTATTTLMKQLIDKTK